MVVMSDKDWSASRRGFVPERQHVSVRKRMTNGTLSQVSLLWAVIVAGACWSSSGRLLAQETAPQKATPAAEKPQTPSEDEAARELQQLQQLLARPVEVPALQQVVTTVSGQQSTVGKSPAAVFVVTQEMIRRSGATSVPETLRMVPGLHVARIDSNKWSVTSRGYNQRLTGAITTSNKLLVLIDGRTVYTPVLGTVYWDVQDVLLDDIDRIEVIRGPGATIWGANAVNGVINIITKPAAETQGGLVKAGGGTEEKGFTSARVGGKVGDNAHYRVFGKWFERDESFNVLVPGDVDDWRQGRGGFRMDWSPDLGDTITVQGDAYTGTSGFFNNFLGTLNRGDERVRGANLLTRWTRVLDDDSDLSLQFYYDRADRQNTIGAFDQAVNTYDLEFRHHFPIADRHNVNWGLKSRLVSDQLASLGPQGTPSPSTYFFEPGERNYDTYSAFVQDEITLVEESLFLTLGTKLEDNDFTDFEVQPSARLLWSPEKSWAAWASVSRAVRTPTRAEHDLCVLQPLGLNPFDYQSSRNFHSEDLMAYEIGYRAQPIEWFSWDAALFYNRYENLLSQRRVGTIPGTPEFLQFFNANDNNGEGYGVELSAQYDVAESWRLSGTYTLLRLNIRRDPSVSLQDHRHIEQASPVNQFFLMSSHDLTEKVQFDLMGRYVDSLPNQNVPSYFSLDLRLAWRPSSRTEFAVVGQNLLDAQHKEYDPLRISPTSPGRPFEIQRGVYGMVTRTW